METIVTTNGGSEPPKGNDAFFPPASIPVASAPPPYAPEAPPPSATASPPAHTLSRTEILRLVTTTRKRAPIEIPEWGGTFYVREMTRAQHQATQATGATQLPDGSMRAHIPPPNVQMKPYMQCIEFESGERVFADSDIGAFLDMPQSTIQRIVVAIDALNKPDTAAPKPDEIASDPT